MKQTRIFLVLALIMLQMIGCSKSESVDIPLKSYGVTISPEIVVFSKDGGDNSVNVVAEGSAWSGIEELPEWLFVEPYNGHIGESKMKIIAKPNTMPVERSFTLTIKLNDCDSVARLTINQYSDIIEYSRTLDSLSLVAFYNTANGEGWASIGPRIAGIWDLNKPMTEWKGVTTELINGELRVVGIDLSTVKNLDGSLSAELGKLGELRSFIINADLLDGDVPEELCFCTKLEEIKLINSYGLVWRFSTYFSMLSSLKVIELQNVDLSSTCLANLYLATSLESLTIYGGRLVDVSDKETISFPNGIGVLTNLNTFILGKLFYLSALPSDLGMCKEMVNLQIGGSKKITSLPANLGNLTKVEILGLNELNLEMFPVNDIRKMTKVVELRMSDLGGRDIDASFLTDMSKLQIISATELPLVGDVACLKNKKDVETLQMHSNKLSGQLKLDEMFGDKISTLGLDNNQIEGTLDGISALTTLRYCYFDRNKLSGELPNEIGKCVNLLHLWLQNNNIEGTIPAVMFDTKIQTNGSLRLHGNCMSGVIPERILTENASIGDTGQTKWLLMDGKEMICPQKPGYGFDNCPD